jgi:hypothetical protein
MRKLSAFELARCLGECREWHEKVLTQLCDAERVEFLRQVAFFEATKRYYRNVLDDDRQVEIRKKKEERFTFIGVILVFFFVSFFEGIDSIEVKVLIALSTVAFVYVAHTNSLRKQSLREAVRMIERDTSAVGVSLTQMYRVIQQEKEHERFWETDSSDEELKERIGLESALLSHCYRMIILRQFVSADAGARVPSCFYDFL